jgi:hypothetical protein
MLSLTRRIQIAAHIGRNSVARFAGEEPPRFEDNESTIGQLHARLARTNDFLKCVPASALEGSETREIKLPIGKRTLSRHMTNGGRACRLLRTEREGNHGADARALPL